MFVKDRVVGNKAEKMFQALLALHGIDSELNNSTNKEDLIKYDVKFGDYTAEVKLDLYSSKSGNIAIEFFNPKQGKVSGIGATTATFWVHVLASGNDAGIWMTRTSLLKSYIESNKPFRVITSGGDDNSSMYLYKKDVILPAIFKNVYGCSKEDFLLFLRG